MVNSVTSYFQKSYEIVLELKPDYIDLSQITVDASINHRVIDRVFLIKLQSNSVAHLYRL